jgi:hypothetical protein
LAGKGKTAAGFVVPDFQHGTPTAASNVFASIEVVAAGNTLVCPRASIFNEGLPMRLLSISIFVTPCDRLCS